MHETGCELCTPLHLLIQNGALGRRQLAPVTGNQLSMLVSISVTVADARIGFMARLSPPGMGCERRS